MRNDNVDFVYRNPRPLLTIESKGGKQLGRCYSSSLYEVTSLHPLSQEDLRRLRESGFLGYGQEFSCAQVIDKDTKVAVPGTLDWRTSKDVKPSGTDMVPCQMYDRHSGEHIPGEAKNPYSGEPYAPNEQAYYVYACESRCDSGD